MLLQVNIGLLWSNVCKIFSLSLRVVFSIVVLAFLFAFSLLGAPTADLSSSRFSRFEMGILAFMLEMSLGHNFNLQSPSLERGLATHVSSLPTLQFASRTDSPTCCQ